MIPQDLPRSDEIRSEAARILDSRDFDFGSDANPRLWDWILRKLEAMSGWFTGLHLTSPVLYWLILIGCLVILAAIFTHAGIVLARSFRAARGKGRAPLGRRDRRSPAALLVEARAAAGRGDIAAALTLYLRAAILGLDLRGLVRMTETATVRDYVRLLGKHPSERGNLQKFLEHYEPGVFGRRDLPRESIQECDVLARRLTGETA